MTLCSIQTSLVKWQQESVFARTFCCERCQRKPFVAWPGISECSVHLGKLLWAGRSAAEPAAPFVKRRPTCSSCRHLCVRNLPANILVDGEPMLRWDSAPAPPLPVPNGIIGGDDNTLLCHRPASSERMNLSALNPKPALQTGRDCVCFSGSSAQFCESITAVAPRC